MIQRSCSLEDWRNSDPRSRNSNQQETMNRQPQSVLPDDLKETADEARIFADEMYLVQFAVSFANRNLKSEI